MLLAISPAETVEFDMVSKRQAFVKVSNPNDFACGRRHGVGSGAEEGGSSSSSSGH